jgi:hypothetical protein
MPFLLDKYKDEADGDDDCGEDGDDGNDEDHGGEKTGQGAEPGAEIAGKSVVANVHVLCKSAFAKFLVRF